MDRNDFTTTDSRKLLEKIFKKYFSNCGFDGFLVKLGQPFLFMSLYHRYIDAAIHHEEIEKNYFGYKGKKGSIKKLIQLRLIGALQSFKDLIDEDINHLKEIK